MLNRLFLKTMLCVILVGVCSRLEVRAEDVGVVSQPSGMPSIAGGPNPDEGIPIAGWMFYPALFVGAVFNDNVHNSAISKKAALGTRLRPSIGAIFDNGIHQMRAYAALDAQVYPGTAASGGSTSSNNVQGSVGISDVYKPTNDLIFNSAFDFTRQLGSFGLSFGGQGTSFSTPTSSVVPAALPQYTNEITGTASVEKKITDQAFVRFTGGIQGTTYDNPASSGGAASLTSQVNGVDYSFSGRVGYWITPVVNVFVESGGDLHRYQDSIINTHGYHVDAGLGSDQIGLFKGEGYGGYQVQWADNGRFAAATSPSFGGRIYYYPTRYLTITGTASETLGAATQTFSSTTDALSNIRVFQASLQADYAFSPYWSAYMRGGYGDTHYVSSPHVDTAWTANVGINYRFWRNFSITLDYQFNRATSASNLVPSGSLGYTQSLVTAGVTYRY